MKPEINTKIQQFYDASSQLWEETWGEHMHHGYYGPDGSEQKDDYQAQVDLIEEMLKWGKISRAKHILDAGCGIGGSSLYLAEKFDCKVTGITISPFQANRARERALTKQDLEDCVGFEVADAMNPPFSPGAFDLVWSLESGEHMPDKRRFLNACFEMLSPGGIFLMATWCHRVTPPALSEEEQIHLQKLYGAYHLPYIISIEEYARLAAETGFTGIEIADWSEAVAPFWQAVVRSIFRLKSLSGLVQSGWTTIRGALAMSLMIRGYRSGLIRFGLLQGKKR
jgi:tocopherol O-methyltransferase